MSKDYPALYECLSPSTDQWVECSAPHCARQRRINKNVDMVLRLEHYKMKLDAKLPLEQIEQDDLDEIAKYVSEMIEAFITAVTEALRPGLEAIAAAAKQLWDSIPEDIRQALKKDSAPSVSVATSSLSNVDLNIARYEAAAQQRRSLP